jgi:hypothetical protein
VAGTASADRASASTASEVKDAPLAGDAQAAEPVAE